MSEIKIDYFNECKIFINQLLQAALRSNGLLPRELFEEYLHKDLIPKPIENTCPQHFDFYQLILRYENLNTEEKLREKYDFLDNQVAEILIKEIDDSGQTEITEEIDKTTEVIEFFTAKGIAEKNISVIESLSQYTEMTSELNLDYLSRGQKNYLWPLLPSALRKDIEGRSLYSKDDVDWMIQEFKRVLKYYDKSFDKKMDLELESYAQHYAIPTNLIDFTEAHILSLLFALEDFESEQYAIVYFVDAMKYNTDMCFRGKSRPIPNCSEEECNAGASSVFIKSDSVNERIHFQKGYFLRVPENYPKEDILEDLYSYTKIILISPENKEHILSELFSMGITFQNIYPDLNNLSSSIKFRNRIKQRRSWDE